MKKISKEVLQLTANKLMFDLTDEQYERLEKEFEVLIKHMNIIGEIEGVDDAEPMSFPFDVTNSYLREDVAEKPLDRKEALKNAQDVVDGQISVPKVVK